MDDVYDAFGGSAIREIPFDSSTTASVKVTEPAKTMAETQQQQSKTVTPVKAPTVPWVRVSSVKLILI